MLDTLTSRQSSTKGHSMAKKFPQRTIGNVIVEKNIPMPIPRGEAISVWPFTSMEVGESFAIQDSETKHRVTNAAFQAGKRNGMKFSVRMTRNPEDAPYRCWRMA